ncbi:L-aspartate oxidase [Ornithinimicrobium sp. Arc0846-15]|nr:L-aspartate oxidase [Ornithinimicrobium laminariae]
MAVGAAPGPIVIVGAGLAGLTTALSLAPNPCLVLTSGEFPGVCASDWAQGGIAAAVGPGDSIAEHVNDTLAAGAGLCDAEAVHRIVRQGAQAVDFLETHGVRFDVDDSGHCDLALEGAHSRPRVLHIGGDTSGHFIMQAIVESVRQTPSITVAEHHIALELISHNDQITGLTVQHGETVRTIAASAVVLATGGAGSLWQFSTNPAGAFGSGIALGLEHGALTHDLEMVQFHPTALFAGPGPMPLISEAVRGQGAVLVNDDGEVFVDSLAARDVVARAVHDQTAAGHQVFLDARAVRADLADHFPAMMKACLQEGLDPRQNLIPVRPAAHYHCGGLMVDARGRTSVPGLWAVGEVASTGLHGANRLASNSLLEAVVTGREAAVDLLANAGSADYFAGQPRSVVAPSPEHVASLIQRHAESWRALATIAPLMTNAAGLVRDAPGLQGAIDFIERRYPSNPPSAAVAIAVLKSALARLESRGGHYRSDYPALSPDEVQHTGMAAQSTARSAR